MKKKSTDLGGFLRHFAVMFAACQKSRRLESNLKGGASCFRPAVVGAVGQSVASVSRENDRLPNTTKRGGRLCAARVA